MLKIKKRHPLKDKDSKELINRIRELYPKIYEKIINGNDIQIEYLLIDNIEIYAINKEPILIKTKEINFFPTINILNKFKNLLPRVVVDSGAVPHIVNGADVMAPGITAIEDLFNENDIVQIIECNYNTTIAIGKALFSSAIIPTIKHGKVIKNIHYVGDKIWESIKHCFPNS